MNLDPNSNCFPNSIPQGFQIVTHLNSNQTQQQHQDHHQMFVPSNSIEVPVPSAANNSSASLLYGLSLLRDRVNQVQTLVTVLTAPDLTHPELAAPSLALATIGNLIQEIVRTATSMMFYCQQLNHLSQASSGTAVSAPTAANNDHSINGNGLNNWDGQQGLCHGTIDNLYAANFSIEATAGESSSVQKTNDSDQVTKSQPREGSSRLGHAAVSGNKIDGKFTDNFEIIELDAADLLAKYTNYCQICGKGFKRDANLRMHMRAHGDEYKTTAALSKPTKIDEGNAVFGTTSGNIVGKKYSCPQEGCRWNKNNPKFQPLKSKICMKNHYKRSHCPKMFVCKRCNGKRFSVLSDLRTHEKHCGDSKWRCTCGTTFSRKDKLMGHVSLFMGHSPLVDDGGIRRSVLAMQIGEAYDRYYVIWLVERPSHQIKPNNLTPIFNGFQSMFFRG